MEDIMNKYDEIGRKSQEASRKLVLLSQEEKNSVIQTAADYLVKNSRYILEQNHLDVEKAINMGMKESLIDRLTLTVSRIENIAKE